MADVKTIGNQGQIQELEKSLREKILAKAAEDPSWMSKYVENPREALQDAGFPEPEQLQKIHQGLKPVDPMSNDEVTGHYYAEYEYYSGSYCWNYSYDTTTYYYEEYEYYA